MPWLQTPLSKLEAAVGTSFPNVKTCFERSESQLAKLQEVLGQEVPAQMSLVVFGSLARKEFTSGSDLDWSLIVDGRVSADHRNSELRIRQLIRHLPINAPNPSGAFGALVFSHELVHCIGGGSDTNANLTRRLLLLLESVEVASGGGVSPSERVLRGILQRYFEEEASFPGKPFFPRFFLNDIVRFWRTMAVDYAAKNAERGGSGWALRNIKLRFSRKLLYLAGLLLSYETSLFPQSDLAPQSAFQQPLLFDDTKPELSSTEHCLLACRLTPLELLARACTNLNLDKIIVREMFGLYDQFLGLLEDSEKRKVLAELSFHDAEKNVEFQNARQLGQDFQVAVQKVFVELPSQLQELTLKYSIF